MGPESNALPLHHTGTTISGRATYRKKAFLEIRWGVSKTLPRTKAAPKPFENGSSYASWKSDTAQLGSLGYNPDGMALEYFVITTKQEEWRGASEKCIEPVSKFFGSFDEKVEIVRPSTILAFRQYVWVIFSQWLMSYFSHLTDLTHQWDLISGEKYSYI